MKRVTIEDFKIMSKKLEEASIRFLDKLKDIT